MVITNVGMLQVSAEGSGEPSAQSSNVWNGTAGELVAENYPLNDYEKAILACSGLAGATYSVEIPSGDNTGLVTVDADAQTVTAKAYTAGGFTWEPTAAVLKYTLADGTAGTDVNVTLNKVGEVYVGNFQKPANSYRAEVTYSLLIGMDEADQKLLLNTPFILAEGYGQLKSAASVLGMATDTIDGKMEELRVLYNGMSFKVTFEGQEFGYTIGLEEDSEVKKALGNLLADYDSNGGRSTLALDIEAYTQAKSKVQFMLEKGAEMKEHISAFFTQIATIEANSDELLELADQLEVLANGTGAGTIAEAKATIDAKAIEAEQLMEEKIQSEIIEVAIQKAEAEYGSVVNLSSLRGKTRENDAIYNEIEAKRDYFKSTAETLKMLGQTALADKILSEEEGGGLYALNMLETAIRGAYDQGDRLIADLLSKKDVLDGYAATAEEKAAEIRKITTSLSQAREIIKTYYNQEWKFIGKKLVKDTITAEEYKALDKAVKAAINSINDKLLVEDRSDLAIKEKLLAEETVLSAMVDQFVVYVEVKAAVVAKNSVNSADLMSLAVIGTNFPMDKDTAAADVLAAITASGIENSALTQWDSFYNIGEEKYTRTVSIENAKGEAIDSFDALTGDIRYIITYSPKTYKINETYLPAGENITEVPYGYNWRLPRPAELTKSYDYEIDGVAHRENTVVRIEKDIEVTREEGKAIAAKTLAELIALGKVDGIALSAKEKNVLNSNAFYADSIYYRTPDSNDKLAKVTTVTGNTFKLEAKPMNAGLLGSDAEWIPVKAYPVLKSRANGADITLAKNGDVYEGTFDCDEEFTSVQVVYQLSIEGLDTALVGDLANIADVLVKDTAEQKATLDALCNQNNFYQNLGDVTGTILGSVGSVVDGMSDEAKAALSELTEKCIDPETDKTYLYGYLTQYKSENGGLAYFYKGDNAANIQKQIDLVNRLLPTIWNDASVQKALVSMGMQGQGTKVESVMAQLKNTKLKAINPLVNTNSAYIDNLLAAVLADGTTSAHNISTGAVTLETILSAGAPGLTSYGVEIQVLNKNDGLVETYKTEAFGAQGNDIPAATFAEMYEALLATVPNNKYYVAEKSLPAEAVKLTEDPAIFTSALRPVSYTVKIDGEADQTLHAFDAYTITLPGTGVAGLKYRYNIGGSKVDVLSGALENFALATDIQAMDALFGTDRELVITRELIDTNKENLLTFIGKLNKAFANGGMIADGKLAAAFIPLQDAQGNLSIVLRITGDYKNLSPASLAGEMMDLVEDLSYVGLNGSPLFGLNGDNEMKLYLQSIINMLVNSNLGLDTIPAMVDENGNINEMQLPGATVIGASGNNLAVEGGIINDVDQLGGKLMESTMQYGVNINNCTSAPFYVTYQDFDTQADLLKKARKGAEQILPYFNLSCRDGAVNMMVNAPDSVYAYLMTALLIVGEVDLDTLQSYNLQEVMDYTLDLINPMFETEGVSADTFINTIDKTGFYSYIQDFDTEANRALIDFIYDSLDHFYDNTSATGTSNGGKYEGIFTYDALDVLLNNKISLGDLSSMVAEKDTGITVPVTFELKNRDVNYEALVLDINAKGITNKYYMTRNAAEAISKVGDNGIIVLLSDIRGNITFNHDVILNLNGCSIDGDLTAKGRVAIVDSTLSTAKCGGVTGDLITSGGDFILGGGKYLSNVEKYLEDGYYLDDNIVTNGCFTIAEKGDDLNVYLSTGYLSLDKTATKIMATDILIKLWMNYYACSQLVVDGNTLYTIDLRNVTESLDDLSKLIGKGMDCFDCAGSSAFATQFMQDVTDFGALAEAMEKGEALVSYSIQNAAFDPYMQMEGTGKDSYFSFNVKAAADKKQFTNLNVLMAEDVPADHQTKIINILKELDTIVTINELKVQIDDVTYSSAGLSAEGEARADVELDLSKNVNYPVIMSAILAYNAKDARRAELVEAIEYYQSSNSAIALKSALEKATAAEVIAALKATKGLSFSAILKALDLTASDAVELEALYTIARKVAGAVADYLDISGNNATLSSLKASGEYATYKYAIQKSADTYAKMSLILFAEEKAITVKDKNGLIYLNTDSLAEALTTLRSGAVIYVNKSVTLEENVVLPALSFKLANAKNIDFGGKTLAFANTNTKLTTDKDLSAHVICDSSVLCSEVASAQMDGWFIFRLEGGHHTPVTDPAKDPDENNTGLTEGSHCDVCGEVLVAQKELAKLPVIHVPTVNVDATDGAVRGAKVDAANKRVYLDVSPNGFSVREFIDVYFKIDNASNSNTTIYKYNTETARGADDLICNGDRVTVWATNKDGAETSVSYDIIIMGDANCDGKLNARDLVLMKLSFVGDLSLEYPGSLAADMNFDGKLNARDTVACDTKYVLWAENAYVSQAK